MPHGTTHQRDAYSLPLDNLAHPGPGDKYRDQLITKLSGTGILRLSILIALVLCGGFLHTGAVQLHLVLI